MTPLPTLALADAFGWTLGVLAGLGLAIYGGRVLKILVRREVLWWGSVAAPLLLVGPALGLLLGCVLTGHEVWRGAGSAHAPANVAWSIILFFGVATLLDLAKSFLKSPFVTEQIGLRLPDLVLDAVRYVLYLVMVFVIVVVVWGQTEALQPLFTASAVGTVILGFALQETLANFFAGVSLLAERAYTIGDWIWIGEHEGEVQAISRRSTRIRTRQGDLITVSNRIVAGGILKNQSKPTPVHAEFLSVSAAYETPPNRVREVLKRAMEDVEGVLTDPTPLVRLLKFGDSAIEYQLKIWTTDILRLPDIRSDALVQIWYHFQRAGIAIPFPIREIRRGSSRAELAPATPEMVHGRLATAPLFKELPAEALTVLARGSHAVDFAAGERIVRQGARGQSCYVVDSGRVGVLLEGSGSMSQVATMGPGELFGEMSLLTGQDRTATVRTLTDARLVEVEAGALREALQLSPELATRLAEVVSLRSEGIVEARAALSADAMARVRENTLRLGDLIRQFFRLPPVAQPPAR